MCWKERRGRTDFGYPHRLWLKEHEYVVGVTGVFLYKCVVAYRLFYCLF